MKTFELLKELLLIETCGAYTTVHDAINLAIQIHCEQNGINEIDFKNKLRIIYKNVWDKYWSNYDPRYHEVWKQCQEEYKQLIDMLA